MILDQRNRIFGSGVTAYSFKEVLTLFESEIPVDSLVQDIISKELEKAKKQGAQEQLEKIKSEIIKTSRDYIRLLTDIVDFVNAGAPKKINNLRLVESRTKFDFVVESITIMFIIDSTLEVEFEFSKLLSNLEKDLLDTENVYANLFYVNKSDKKIDERSIYQDYPSKRLYPKNH